MLLEQLNTHIQKKKRKTMTLNSYQVKIFISLLAMDLNISESESHSVVPDSATPYTIQTMEFSRPEYWSR